LAGWLEKWSSQHLLATEIPSSIGSPDYSNLTSCPPSTSQASPYSLGMQEPAVQDKGGSPGMLPFLQDLALTECLRSYLTSFPTRPLQQRDNDTTSHESDKSVVWNSVGSKETCRMMVAMQRYD
jgi:hypothetical protein